MSGVFSPPEGDHAGIMTAARLCGTLAGDYKKDKAKATTAATEAAAHWQGKHADLAARAAGGLQIELDLLIKRFDDAHAALQSYARHFQTISADIAEYKRKYDAQHAGDGVRVHPKPKPFGPATNDLFKPGPPDTSKPLTLPPDTTDYEELARQAKRQLTGYAHTASDRLDKAVSTIVTGKQKLTPAQIRRQVTATQHIHDHTTGIAGALANIAGAARDVPPGAVNPDGTVDWDQVRQVPKLPAKGATPAEVNTWWKSLDTQQQTALINKQTATIGNLDGIPCTTRDTANRISLTAYLAALGNGSASLPDSGLSYSDFQKLQSALGPSAASSNQFLLGFKPNEGQGHAITSYGNPDTATNTSTLVGGVSTGMGSLPQYMGYAKGTWKWAKQYGAQRPATITWFGYDAPPTLFSGAASDSRAQAGAAGLDKFQTGLRATHQGIDPSLNTVIGHSYGSLLVGEAASHDHTLNADNIIFIGSPGVGVDHASDFHLTGVAPERTSNHIFASRAANDVIQAANQAKTSPWIPVVTGLTFGPLWGAGAWAEQHHERNELGADPNNTAFGDQRFASDPGPQWHGTPYSVKAHTNYWSYNNKSLMNMGSIIAGRGIQYAE